MNKLIIGIVIFMILSGCSGYYKAQEEYYKSYDKIAIAYIEASKREIASITDPNTGYTIKINSQAPPPVPTLAPPQNIFLESLKTVSNSTPLQYFIMGNFVERIIKASTGDSYDNSTHDSSTHDDHSATATPTVVNPEVVNPEVVNPVVVNPEVVRPEIVKPEVIQQSTNTSVIGNPLYPFE